MLTTDNRQQNSLQRLCNVTFLLVFSGFFFPFQLAASEFIQPKLLTEEKTQLERFLGDMQAILAQPTKVEGYIIDSNPASSNVQEENKLGGYPVVKGPVALTPEQVKKAQAVLLNEKSYYWGRLAKKCLLVPVVALRFLKGNQEVSILFSTYCDLWSFAYQDKLATKDYAPAAKEVNRLLSIVFPEEFSNQTQ